MATVMITMERLAELEAADAKLAALEAAGVDNWVGYPEAMALIEQEDDGPSDAEIDAVTSIKIVTDAEEDDSDEDDADEESETEAESEFNRDMNRIVTGTADCAVCGRVDEDGAE